MMRWLVVPIVLGACSTHPPTFATCPPPVAIPAPTVAKPNVYQIAALQRRVESARRAERARGDACAQAVHERDEWIRKR